MTKMLSHNNKIENLLIDLSKINNIDRKISTAIVDELKKLKIIPPKTMNKTEYNRIIDIQILNNSEKLEDIDEQVKGFSKITKIDGAIEILNRYIKEQKIPDNIDILKLENISYQEKKKLLDDIQLYYDANLEEQFSLQYKINDKLKLLAEFKKSGECHRYFNDQTIPDRNDILKLKHVPYEEKKELMDKIFMYHEVQNNCDYDRYEDKLALRDEINFRYKNLTSIRKVIHKKAYKRAREVDYPTYNEILDRNLTDEGADYMIRKLNRSISMMSRDYDKGSQALKQIRYEIDNGGHSVNTKMEFLKKIKDANMPTLYKEKLYFMLSNSDEDDAKVFEYVKQAIQIPFHKLPYNIPDSMGEFCLRFKNILDQKLYGMEKIKEELITTVCCKVFTTNSKYKAIALVGPPGTGKTTIARTIAEVFNAPFEQISMNTVGGGSDLTGHNFTYVGSQPGRIAKALIKMKCNNGVLFLDELDKANDNHHDSVSKTLMNICDFSQNHEFVDNYFQDFKIDLSNLLIVCSLNDASKLGYVLNDRIKLVQVHGYNEKEKMEISKKIVEKTLDELELNKDSIIINKEVISHLISVDDKINKMSTDNENSGVRGLESIIKHLVERLKILSQVSPQNKTLSGMSYCLPHFKLPYTLTTEDANVLLINYGTQGKGRMDILEKINKSLLPDYNKQDLRSMLANTSEENHDYPKIMEYIRLALSIPYNKIQYDIPKSLTQLYIKFKKELDNNLYGMDKVKEELITSICCKIQNNNVKYKAIALVGPPGTGKTTIARTIAKVFNVSFEQINMNGIGDGGDLTGHNYTYVGAKPGRIVKALIKMKCSNGVLFLDEIDKINNDKRSSASDALMNVLDFTQNCDFTDNYFQDIKIDLSNLLIVCSLNEIGKLNHVLADRIKFIQVDGYTNTEKIKIGHNMKQKICKEFNILDNDIIVPNAMMKYIINKAKENDERLGNREHGGVRGLESAIKHIIERMKILIDTMDDPLENEHISYKIKDFRLPHEITTSNIDLLLKNFMAKDDMPQSIRNMYI